MSEQKSPTLGCFISTLGGTWLLIVATIILVRKGIPNNYPWLMDPGYVIFLFGFIVGMLQMTLNKRLMKQGCLITLIGGAIAAIPPALGVHTPWWIWGPGLFICGIGMMCALAAVNEAFYPSPGRGNGQKVKKEPAVEASTSQHALSNYLHQKLEHSLTPTVGLQTKKWHYSSHQTETWLNWLSVQMQRNHLSEFSLEDLQPAWLPTELAQKLFYPLLRGVVIGACIGLVFALFGGVSLNQWLGAVLLALIIWLFTSVFVGAIPVTSIQMVEKISWSWRRYREVLRFLPRFVVASGLLVFVFIGLLIGLLTGVVDGLRNGLSVGIADGLHYGLEFELELVLPLLLLVVVFIMITGGLDKTTFEKHQRVKPNQGIHSSGWIALRLAMIYWLLGTLLALLGFWVLSTLWGTLMGGIPASVLVGLTFGFFMGLYHGGRAYLNHYTLRFYLWRTGVMPLNYVRFLEEATKRKLLVRVGGSYRFIY